MRVEHDVRVPGGVSVGFGRTTVRWAVAVTATLLVACDGPVAPEDSTPVREETGDRPSGTVLITSLTTGSGSDPDGYGVSIDGASAGSVGGNGSKAFDGLAPGDHEIGLFGLSFNCGLIGTNRRTVDVAVDETTSTEFPVACDPGTPEISPGGTDIAFASHRGGSRNPQIYVMGADGSDPVGISGGALWNAYPAWSADHRWIAFDGSGDIYVMRPDGSGRRRITSGWEDWWSAWSPDGSRIAFTRDVSGWFEFEIYVMEADGRNPVRLTHDTGGDKPTWSPDGRQIAFSTNRDGNYEIYVMESDGSNLVNLTRHPEYDGQPAWSR